MKLLQASPNRQELPNEALLRTGIAPLSHLSYDKQLAFKQQQVENVLAKIAKLPEIKVNAPIGMENHLVIATKRKSLCKRFMEN